MVKFKSLKQATTLPQPQRPSQRTISTEALICSYFHFILDYVTLPLSAQPWPHVALVLNDRIRALQSVAYLEEICLEGNNVSVHTPANEQVGKPRTGSLTEGGQSPGTQQGTVLCHIKRS
jgi:hypothetical protein